LYNIKLFSLNINHRRNGILQKLGCKHHEYWSWWLLVIPIWPLWIWYGFRLRCATWFTAVNPGMEDSGFVSESKIKILNSIPDYLKPTTLFIFKNEQFEAVKGDSFFNAVAFPMIAKPDIGGRGRKVEILKDWRQLHTYHETIGEDYMVQELIPYDLEMGIFYVRIPNEKKGRVTSIAIKDFLKVIGDGKSTVEALMRLNYRAALQIERLKKTLDISIIPLVDEIVYLEPIGNHCRGTAFLDGRNLMNDKLNEIFDDICNQIHGFYYGRFDIRVKSLDDLYAGKHIYIMELNGLTADAAHIFDPNSRLRDAYFTQIENCKLSFQIAKQNLANGVKPTPFKELFGKVVQFMKE
jgi:hypothetical protein